MQEIFYSQNYDFIGSLEIGHSHTTDILIIGAGMAGLACAHKLSSSRNKVSIIEAGEIGATGGGLSAGMLGLDVEIDYSEVKATFRQPLYHLSNGGMKSILKIIQEYTLSADVTTNQGSVYLCRASSKKYYREEIKIRKELGINGTQILTKDELGEIFLTKKTYDLGVYEPVAHSFNPRAFARGLAKELSTKGVQCFENQPIRSIDLRNKNATTMQGGKIDFKKVVLCLGFCPLLFQLAPKLQRGVVPAYSSILVTPKLSADQIKNIFPNEKRPLLWNDRFFYNYSRLTPDGRILFGGAERILSNKEASSSPISERIREKSYQKLLKEFFNLLPSLKSVKPDFFWGGIIAASVDQFPYIGELAPDSYAALFGNGLNLSFASGEIIAQKILGEKIDNSIAPNVDINRKIDLVSQMKKLATRITPLRAAINFGVY